MKKREVLDVYTFLANGVKMNALSDPSTRADFITFFRELRKLAEPVRDEVSSTKEPPLDSVSEEALAQIYEEEVQGELPKINEDCLLSVIAESQISVPISIVLNVFKPLIA